MKRPAWLGILVAPVAPVLVWYWMNARTLEQAAGVGVAIGIIYAALVSYGLALVLFVPALLVLRRYRVLSFWWIVLTATALGIVLPYAMVSVDIAAEISKTSFRDAMRFAYRALLSAHMLHDAILWATWALTLAVAFCLIVGAPYYGRATDRNVD